MSSEKSNHEIIFNTKGPFILTTTKKIVAPTSPQTAGALRTAPTSLVHPQPSEGMESIFLIIFFSLTGLEVQEYFVHLSVSPSKLPIQPGCAK